MTDLKNALDLVNQFNTPMLCLITWLVFRLYTNHLPHILDSLNRIDRNLSRLEGRLDGQEKEKSDA